MTPEEFAQILDDYTIDEKIDYDHAMELAHTFSIEAPKNYLSKMRKFGLVKFN